MTRGFLTVATGNLIYSKMAYYLLMSFRRFNAHHYPFAVITDKANNWLNTFDIVIELPNCNYNFLDKLLCFVHAPFDETIFIDSDSLVYKDLDSLFNYFKDADDISCVGNCFERESDKGWLIYENTLQFKDKIKYNVWLHGGIYFIRKSERAELFYQTCMSIVPYYKRIFTQYKYLTEPADEPIVALAMAIVGYKPIYYYPEILAFYRDSKISYIDILTGSLRYTVSTGSTNAGCIIHFATQNTKKAVYQNEIKKLEWSIHNSRKQPSALLKAYWKTNLLLGKQIDRFKERLNYNYIESGK